ncbi:MAG: DUF1367 family protein [Candidatus Nanopelagicales bacterium]|nr:DUF1367 family protein [Candidatus Nanopelagicales bacterium]
MARIMLVKKLSALYPVDEEAQAVMRTIGQGEIIATEIRRPRNLAFHRRLFAMLHIVLENQTYYKSMDDLLDVAKLAVGHYRTIGTKWGDVRIPSSISFAAMDQPAFQEFYDKVVEWVTREVIPGLRRSDLDEEVEAQLLAFGETA